MSSPIIWIIIPGLVAFVLIFLSRYRILSLIIASLTTLVLVVLAMGLNIGEVVALGSWAFIVEDQLSIAGRSLVISNLDRPQIALFYLALSFWLFGATVISVPPLFVPLGLASTAVLIASLSVQPILYAALLIEVAILLFVLMLTPMGRPVHRGILRFLTYQTLGLPFILTAGWFLSGIELEAGNTQDITRAAIFLGFGFAFHLGIFPLHSWIPMLTEKAHPYVTTFVIATLLSVGILLPVGFMQRYPSLYENLNLLEILRLIGVLMVLVGGVWGTFQRDLGRILGFAMIVETGRTILAISLPGGSQLLFGLLFPRILAFGVWALSLSILKTHVFDFKFRNVQGYGRKFPISAIGIVLANFSVAGIPVLAGFPINLILWEQLATFGGWVAVATVVGSAGLIVGGLRSLAVLVMGPEEMPIPDDAEQDKESFFPSVMILVGVGAIFLVGLFPQWFFPLLTSITVTFGSLTP